MTKDKAKPKPVCVWREDYEGNWKSSCRKLWSFEEDSPADNDVRFCPWCGRKVKIVRLPT